MYHTFFFFYEYATPRDLPSSPTRRSPDLGQVLSVGADARRPRELPGRPRTCLDHFMHVAGVVLPLPLEGRQAPPHQDRKSTRLNSSHANISYAVFCLKKKKKYTIKYRTWI